MENKLSNIKKPNGDLTGVSSSVATKVYNMLVNGRRYFGSAGAYMSNVANNPDYKTEFLNKAYATENLKAEHNTSDFLKNWIKDKPNAVLIESVLVPGEKLNAPIEEEVGIPLGVDTDHIIVIGNEVILIDTKAWKKKKTFSLDTAGQVLMTKKLFMESDLFMAQSLPKWLNYLDSSAKLTAIVVIQQDETTVLRNKNWFDTSYRLVEKDRFEELLNEKWSIVSARNKDSINSSLVAQLIVNCIKPYNAFEKLFSTDALKSFK